MYHLSQTARIAQDDYAPDLPDLAKMEVLQFSPSPAIAPYIEQFYYFRCDAPTIRDMQPASLAHMLFFLRGSGQMTFQDGHVDIAHRVNIFGPCTAAAEYTCFGPVQYLGASFTPLGFVALTGISAQQNADQMINAADIFGDEITNLSILFQAGMASGSMQITDLIRELTAFLLKHVRTIPSHHIRMIDVVRRWVSSEYNPDVVALYADLAMSRSTASRLIRRYFGCPPKLLMRKERALRAASHLIDHKLDPIMRSKVEAYFYDQPHMIREIRHFIGRTPGALNGEDAKMVQLWLGQDNFLDIDSYQG